MSISDYVKKVVTSESIFNDMFSIAGELKKKYGANNICDFSIGNPDLPPPKQFKEALKKVVEEQEDFKYSPFAGIPEVKNKVAEIVSKQQGVEVPGDNVFVTCGAEHAINVMVKVYSNYQDEVILSTPFYPYYEDTLLIHNVKPVVVKCKDDLDLDVDGIEKAITDRTKLIIINSPNNPSGRIYPEETLRKLAEIIKNKDIVVISDEVYRDLNYGKKIPDSFKIFDNSVVISSTSKGMSCPTARFGYIVLNPKLKDLEIAKKATNLVNVISIIEPPIVEQKASAMALGYTSDLEKYKIKMDKLLKILREIGYEVGDVEGAFYLFPKTPIKDDVRFCKDILVKYNIICTPGTPFGSPGHMRISCCCDDNTIERCKQGFKNAFEEAKK
ncbi:MAG: aminotransferase class I/II-fold pyridoxal phosphate-dependent enzyme [Rickettsiales bacterium]|jgi:aspartate aminotransferase|nr:aminotransferase class I/II-fold pyridoxal phosphate-dependent enzyme [Rickettsiales bacterium]